MIKLGVNIDHIATLREARKTYEPDPLNSVIFVENGGGDGITVHLREDRRHIHDRDVKLLRDTIGTKMNLEMSLAPEIVEIALKVGPDLVTVVPEKRAEVTTEGGLDCRVHHDAIKEVLKKFNDKGIETSLFIDPDPQHLELAKELGAIRIELHTGNFANLFFEERGKDSGKWKNEMERLFLAARKGHELGMGISAGHGLNYNNIKEIKRMPNLTEVNIGHAIIARSVFTGLEKAVRDMVDLLK